MLNKVLIYHIALGAITRWNSGQDSSGNKEICPYRQKIKISNWYFTSFCGTAALKWKGMCVCFFKKCFKAYSYY